MRKGLEKASRISMIDIEWRESSPMSCNVDSSSDVIPKTSRVWIGGIRVKARLAHLSCIHTTSGSMPIRHRST